MSYARLAQRLFNTPLLITAEKLDVLDHVLRAYEEGRAKLLSPYEKKERPELALNGAPQMTQEGYIRTAQGVAIIPVIGTLVQRTGGMDAESGLTSYAQIGAQVAAAISDPQTRGILLEVDSPGGEANGVFDLAAEIRAASGIKPIFAHAGEQALSAGYAVASAAEAVYTPRTGLVGSIGARMRHVDQSQYDAKRGFVYTDIVSGERKADMSPHEPLSDPARQFMQDHVDRLGNIFTAHVADMRGIDEQAVRDTAAAIIHADQAESLGLINGVATINETMQLLLDRIATQSQPNYGMRAAARAPIPARSAQTDEGVTTMADPKETTYTAAQLAEAETRSAAKAKADAEAEAAKKLAEAGDSGKAAAKAASEAERKRIQAIQTCEAAKGKPALAAHLALETDMSVEQATALLAKAAPEAGATSPTNLLAAHMANVPNPKVGADGSGGDGEETEAAVVARIMNAGKPPKLTSVAK